MRLANKTVFVSGGSRGVGLEIAPRAARDGADVALIAKTAEPHNAGIASNALWPRTLIATSAVEPPVERGLEKL